MLAIQAACAMSVTRKEGSMRSATEHHILLHIQPVKTGTIDFHVLVTNTEDALQVCMCSITSMDSYRSLKYIPMPQSVHTLSTRIAATSPQHTSIDTHWQNDFPSKELPGLDGQHVVIQDKNETGVYIHQSWIWYAQERHAYHSLLESFHIVPRNEIRSSQMDPHCTQSIGCLISYLSVHQSPQ
jgi:hypothetical protein